MSPSTWCAVCVQLNRATNVLPRPEIRTCAREDHEKIPKVARVWEEAERVGDDESREDLSCCTRAEARSNVMGVGGHVLHGRPTRHEAMPQVAQA